jgi:hypothetical protein
MTDQLAANHVVRLHSQPRINGKKIAVELDSELTYKYIMRLYELFGWRDEKKLPFNGHFWKRFDRGFPYLDFHDHGSAHDEPPADYIVLPFETVLKIFDLKLPELIPDPNEFVFSLDGEETGEDRLSVIFYPEERRVEIVNEISGKTGCSSSISFDNFKDLCLRYFQLS